MVVESVAFLGDLRFWIDVSVTIFFVELAWLADAPVVSWSSLNFCSRLWLSCFR